MLEGVIKGLADSTQRVTDQPALFLRMHIAQNRLQMGEVEECKNLVEQGKEQLDKMHDVSSKPVVICICCMLWVHLLSAAWPGWLMQRRCRLRVGTTLCCVDAWQAGCLVLYLGVQTAAELPRSLLCEALPGRGDTSRAGSTT